MALSNTINDINTKIDLSVQVFDNFYRYRDSIPAQEYDVVLSYFKSFCKTAAQAKNFTTTLFRVSSVSGISVPELLQQMQSTGDELPQITIILAYYLNTIQSPATMIGIKTPYTPNYYVARNIRQ